MFAIDSIATDRLFTSIFRQLFLVSFLSLAYAAPFWLVLYSLFTWLLYNHSGWSTVQSVASTGSVHCLCPPGWRYSQGWCRSYVTYFLFFVLRSCLVLITQLPTNKGPNGDKETFDTGPHHDYARFCFSTCSLGCNGDCRKWSAYVQGTLVQRTSACNYLSNIWVSLWTDGSGSQICLLDGNPQSAWRLLFGQMNILIFHVWNFLHHDLAIN